MSFPQITPEMLAQLAQNFDPTPVMQELQTSQMPPAQGSAQMSAGNMAPGEGAMQGPGLNSWQDVMSPMGGGKKMAPLDPRALAQLQGMMPQIQKPQFVSGSAPRQAVPVNLSIPDISNLVKIHLGNQNQAAAPAPTLGSLMGGR